VCMVRLDITMDKTIADIVRQRAADKGITMSAYIRNCVLLEMTFVKQKIKLEKR